MGPPTETRLCDTLERAVKDSAPGLGASVMSARLASSGFLSFETGGMATLASRCVFHVRLRLPRHPSAQLLDITWLPFFSESHAGSQHPILPRAIPELYLQRQHAPLPAAPLLVLDNLADGQSNGGAMGVCSAKVHRPERGQAPLTRGRAECFQSQMPSGNVPTVS